MGFEINNYIFMLYFEILFKRKYFMLCDFDMINEKICVICGYICLIYESFV